MSGRTRLWVLVGPSNAHRLGQFFALAVLLAAPCTAIAEANAAQADPIPRSIDAPPISAESQADDEGGPELDQAPAGEIPFAFDAKTLSASAGRLTELAIRRYGQTPPGDRVAWGGLAVCCLLGLSILSERLARLRVRKIIPADFTAKFLDRLHGGKLDAGRALDYCEQNPSPAARIALAAVRRWGRPAADLERAVALAHRVESDKLRRNAGTLRRVSAMSPLLGFLGTLLAAGRTLASIPPELGGDVGPGPGFQWGPELASALAPLTAGIVVATLSLVAYDGLLARIERLTEALDRLGAETIDAIAMSIPSVPSSLTVPTCRSSDLASEGSSQSFRMHGPTDSSGSGIFGLIRAPHQSPTPQAKVDERKTLRLPSPRTDGQVSAQA